MPTYAQLQAEPWWSREFAPPTLAALRSALLARWGLSGSAIGIKGNNVHLRGYHRSREWIKNSAYCTNRTYSVSETAGNKSGGDSRWLAGMDITLPTTLLLQVCKRLDAAVRNGALEKVTEWYGNLDGDTIVDGYNNIANRVATSDSSHLWHLHISLDRGRAAEDHTDLYQILTGDDDVSAAEVFAYKIGSKWLADKGITLGEGQPFSEWVKALGILLYNDQLLRAELAAMEAREVARDAAQTTLIRAVTAGQISDEAVAQLAATVADAAASAGADTRDRVLAELARQEAEREAAMRAALAAETGT